MDYKETVDFLYAQLPIYQRVGKTAYKKDLTNTLRLTKALGNPHEQFHSIHIAGTNGKGSSAHLLESILLAAGYRVGLYTSPHLKDFTERIRYNSFNIPEEEVVRFVREARPFVEAIRPSFFELTVAMAFWFFKQKDVDLAVIETGLGGRLDSTNVIKPLASLITMIGWDHMDILGDTLEKIAREKAGIIKPRVPVIVGADQPKLLRVFEEKARTEQSPLTAQRRAYSWRVTSQSMESQVIDLFRDDKPLLEGLEVNTGAAYVLENLPGVLDVINVLRSQGFEVTDQEVRQGLRTLEIKGRWQVLGKQPMVLADVSHNVSGLKRLFAQLNETPGSKHIIFGMVKEKEVSELLQLLPREAQYYWTQSAVPRSLPVAQLANAANELGLSGEEFPEVNAALTKAKEQASHDDIILVCGSTFVVAEIAQL